MKYKRIRWPQNVAYEVVNIHRIFTVKRKTKTELMIHRRRCQYNIEKDLCDVIMCGWTGVVYKW